MGYFWGLWCLYKHLVMVKSKKDLHFHDRQDFIVTSLLWTENQEDYKLVYSSSKLNKTKKNTTKFPHTLFGWGNYFHQAVA